MEDQFCFLPIRGLSVKSKSTQLQRARSHAIKHALAKKRSVQQQTGQNFLASKLGGRLEQVAVPQVLKLQDHEVITFLLGSDSHVLLQQRQSEERVAFDPVFSIADELILPNFRSIFQTGLCDPALLSATMLTFSFATMGTRDRRFFESHSQVLQSIRGRMDTQKTAVAESTLGAILLLAGIETRLGMPTQVELHMNAILELLKLARTNGDCLTSSIKRAIFWQDLNSSVMTGSHRVVDHHTFLEMQWSRTTSTPDAYTLPIGFQSLSSILSFELREVLEDIHALQQIRDSKKTVPNSVKVPFMAQIDNHQASIQSRLVSMRPATTMADCIRLAAYLSAAMLRCKLWPTSVVPSYLSLKLLCQVEISIDDSVWDTQPELLLWVLFMGGAFAPGSEDKHKYSALLSSKGTSRLHGLYSSWPQLLRVLERFIWSNNAFRDPVNAFWTQYVSHESQQTAH